MGLARGESGFGVENPWDSSAENGILEHQNQKKKKKKRKEKNTKLLNCY